MPSPPLSSVEVEFIDLFVETARLLGLPKSFGEIYGLLFASSDPLSMDEIIARLKMSKGSASQGLNQLKTFGAVKSIYVKGDRRNHFVAEAELKRLVGGFARQQFIPHLDNGIERLDQLADHIAQTNEDDSQVQIYQERLNRLKSWHRKAQKTLPILLTLIGEKGET